MLNLEWLRKCKEINFLLLNAFFPTAQKQQRYLLDICRGDGIQQRFFGP